MQEKEGDEKKKIPKLHQTGIAWAVPSPKPILTTTICTVLIVDPPKTSKEGDWFAIVDYSFVTNVFRKSS